MLIQGGRVDVRVHEYYSKITAVSPSFLDLVSPLLVRNYSSPTTLALLEYISHTPTTRLVQLNAIADKDIKVLSQLPEIRSDEISEYISQNIVAALLDPVSRPHAVKLFSKYVTDESWLAVNTELTEMHPVPVDVLASLVRAIDKESSLLALIDSPDLISACLLSKNGTFLLT